MYKVTIEGDVVQVTTSDGGFNLPSQRVVFIDPGELKRILEQAYTRGIKDTWTQVHEPLARLLIAIDSPLDSNTLPTIRETMEEIKRAMRGDLCTPTDEQVRNLKTWAVREGNQELVAVYDELLSRRAQDSQ